MDAVSTTLNSLVLSGLDIFEPQDNATLFRTYKNQGLPWLLALQIMGAETPATGEEYYAWQEGKIWESFTVRATVADPGAGNNIVIVLAAGSVNASNQFFPQPGDDVMFKNQVAGYIKSIDVTTPAQPALTIAPKVVTANIGQVVAGDTVIVYSNSSGEAGTMPAARTSKPTRVAGHLKIIETTFSATGTEMSNGIRLKKVDGAGNILGWYDYNRQIATDYQHALKISHALLVDQLNTNPTQVIDPTTVSGNAVAYSTEGLVTAIAARGNSYPKASGAFALTDFDAIDLVLTKQFNEGNMLCLLGKKRMQNIRSILQTANYNTGVDFTETIMNSGLVGDGADARSKAVNLDFTALKIGNRWYYFKELMEFNMPDTLGATGFPYPDMMLMVPAGMTADAKTRELIPYSGVRYKKLGDYSRRAQAWSYGAAGKDGTFVGNVDMHYDYMRSHIGAQHVNVNQCVIV